MVSKEGRRRAKVLKVAQIFSFHHITKLENNGPLFFYILKDADKMGEHLEVSEKPKRFCSKCNREVYQTVHWSDRYHSDWCG